MTFIVTYSLLCSITYNDELVLDIDYNRPEMSWCDQHDRAVA